MPAGYALRPGLPATFHLVTSPTPALSTRPARIILQLAMLGPYADVSALKQSVGGTGTGASKAVLGQAKQVTEPRVRLHAAAAYTTSWVADPPPVRLVLPKGLPGGWYDVHFTASSGAPSVSEDQMVKVR